MAVLTCSRILITGGNQYVTGLNLSILFDTLDPGKMKQPNGCPYPVSGPGSDWPFSPGIR